MQESRDNPSQRLLAANMWAIYNYGDPNKRYQQFLNRGREPFRSMIDGLLLYDQVIVPTQDYMSLAILVGVLGQRSVLELLERRCLRFLRIKGSLAYVGNGGGILAFKITSPDGHPRPFCDSLEQAAKWALIGLKDIPIDPVLGKKVVDATHEIDIGDLDEEVRHETYMDVLNSEILRDQFSIRNTHMNRLAGIEPNGSRIYGGPDGDWKGDEIDVVLALAATNLELRLADIAECADSSTASPVGHVLKAKAERCLGREKVEGFATLREIAEIPDIAGLVQQEAMPDRPALLSRLLKLRSSRNAEQFRAWFHANSANNCIDVAKEYVKLLRQVPRVQSLPGRVIRFLVTSAIGLVPLAGPAASFVDSFFMERLLRGSSPKFFIDDLCHFVNRKP